MQPDDVERVAEVFGPLRASAPGTTSRPFEVRIRGGTGEYRWLEMVATNLVGDRLVDGIVVNARDVTERRQARRRAPTRSTSRSRRPTRR